MRNNRDIIRCPRHAGILLLFCTLCLGITGLTQDNAFLREQIEKLIRYDAEVPIGEAPGFIVGIVDGDSTYILSFGRRTRGGPDTLDASDVFELGSITKVYTAVLMLHLTQNGLLNLSDQLNGYLPEMYRNAACKATLMDILLHRGGFPKVPGTLGQMQEEGEGPYAVFTRQDLLEWYRDADFRDTTTHRYAHTGYALLEVAAEYATGIRFPVLFEHLFGQRMELEHTTLSDTIEVTPGHDFAMRQVEPWKFASFVASEGVRSSMRDLISFLRILLGSEGMDTGLIHIRQPTEERMVFVSPGLYCVLPKRRFPVWMHTGQTSGHSAMIAFAPKTQTGVAILCNAPVGTGELGMLILRMINSQWKRKN